MKVFWQILTAVLVAVVAAAAAATVEMRPEVAESAAWSPCYGSYRRYGCMSIISSMEPIQKPDLRIPLEEPIWNPKPTLKPDLRTLLEELLTRRVEPVRVEEEDPSLSRPVLLKLPFEVNARTKRANKAVATVLGRRRGKPRGEGSRPACTGCYSWLTMWGQPAQDGKNASAKFSHSESGESSSGGN